MFAYTGVSESGLSLVDRSPGREQIDTRILVLYQINEWYMTIFLSCRSRLKMSHVVPSERLRTWT